MERRGLRTPHPLFVTMLISPINSVAWLASIAACGLGGFPCARAADPPPPTVAIVPTATARSGLADLLTADLSTDAGVRLVERQAVARVVDELKLGAGGDAAAELKLGQLLAADAVVMLEAGSGETPPRVRVRVVESRTGIRLADEEWVAADLVTDRAALLAGLRAGLQKFRVPPEGRRLVGIVGLRSEEEVGPVVATARALTVFAEQDLQRLPGVVVLEREQLRRLTTERDLTGTELDLRASASLLEGSLRREGDTFVIALALVPLKDGKPLERTITTPGTTNDARDAIAKALAGMLAARVEAVAAGPTAEANLLLQRARKLLSFGDATQASRLAEAAYVLRPCQETFALAASLSQAALPADANAVDVAQAGLRQAELIGDFYERTTESLAWEALFPVELLHSVWSPLPAPASAEEAEIRDRIRAVERATADRVLAFRRAAERPTTGYVLLRQLALAELLAPGTPRASAADFMRYVTDLHRELATEARARRLPDGPAYTIGSDDSPVVDGGHRIVFAREVFAKRHHEALVAALTNRRGRPAVDEIAPLVDGLVADADPALRIIGWWCRLNEPGPRGLAVAERILDVCFRRTGPPWTLDEVECYKTVAQIAAEAVQRLAAEGRAAAYTEALVAEAERRGDGGIVMGHYDAFARLVLSDPGRAGGFRDRVESLLTARMYPSDMRLPILRWRRAIRSGLDEQAGRGRFAAPPTPPVGPWAEYVIEPVTFTNAPPGHPRLVAASVDRRAADESRAIQLLWASAAPAPRTPDAPATWAHVLTRCGPAGGQLAEVAAFDLPTPSITTLCAGDGRFFIGTADRGLFVVDGRGVTAIGDAEGLPSNTVGAMAWLDGRLYMGVPRGLATYAPDTGAATLASAASVVPRHQLDGGEPYAVIGILADPVRHRLWMTVAGDRSRSGLWCHTPRDGVWQRVLNGGVSGPFWNGGRTALVSLDASWGDLPWTYREHHMPFEIDLDDGGHVPLWAFVKRDPTHRLDGWAGMAMLDGHLFAGHGRLLDTDGGWYQPPPPVPPWTTIEQVGESLVAIDLQAPTVTRIRRRGAAAPPRTPADARAAMRSNAQLRAVVAGLRSDTPAARLAALQAFLKWRWDYHFALNQKFADCASDEAIAGVLLDHSRPSEQRAALNVLRQFNRPHLADTQVLRRLAEEGAPEIAAAARAEVTRLGSANTYLIEQPEVDTRSSDPLKRAAGVAKIGEVAVTVPAALAVLVRMLDDEVDFVALAAVAELGPCGDEALTAILDAAARAADRGDARRALRMLARRLEPPEDAAIDSPVSIAWMRDRLAELARSPDAKLATAAGRARAACDAIAERSSTSGDAR